jgi:predicted transposase/invertase (TIGR01784 family)
MKKTLLSPLQDYVFKFIFGRRQNIRILAGFLKTLLNIPEDEFDHLTVANPILPRWFRKDKTGILDVLVHTTSGTVINVEVQVIYSPSMRNRVVYYHGKLHCEQIKIGENFNRMRPEVNIVICDHVMLDEETAYLNSYSLRNDLSHRQFTDLTQMIILELPKLPEADDGTAPWPWLRFFTCRTLEELEMLVKEHPEVKEAAITLRKISFRERWQRAAFLRDKWRRDVRMWTQDARDEGLAEGLAEGREAGLAEGREAGLAEGLVRGHETGREAGLTEGLAKGREAGRTEGRETGRAEGREAGREEGREADRREIARKMKASGYSTEQIVGLTGLSPEEIGG